MLDTSRDTLTSRWSQAQPLVSLLFRLTVGGVLLVAGLLKIGDLSGSVRSVRAYELLPESLVVLVGVGLPVLEIALGLLLVVGLWTRTGAVLSGLLLVVFMVGIASAWARGLSIDCGCFGGGGAIDPDDTAYVSELLRDAALLAACAVLVRWPASYLSLDHSLGRVTRA